MNQHSIFIINPASKALSTGKHLPKIQKRIKKHFPGAEILRSGKPGDITKLARKAAHDGAHNIILVGGDGTVNEGINGVLDESGRPITEKLRIGIVPSGTGSDFRRTFAWPDGIEDNLRRLRQAKTRFIDVGCVRGIGRETDEIRYYVNVASFGASGLVAKYLQSAKKSLGGMLSYYVAAFRALLKYKGGAAEVDVDGERIDLHRLLLFVVANGKYFGGGMKIAPAARVDSGFVEALWADGVGFPFFLRHGVSVYSGKHVKLPQVHTRQAKRVVAKPLGGAQICIELDGEEFGLLPASFEVLPRALPILD